MAEAPTDIARAMRLAHAMFGKQPRVTGIDYGYAHRGGQRTQELCLRIHVDEKRSRALCKPLELVPPEIGGIKTDVIERRYHHTAGQASNPGGVVQPGRGVGNPKARAGTVGLIVFDAGAPAVLSCFHVLAGPAGAVGDVILLPAVEAGGSIPQNVVGKLQRFFPPGLWGDAAIALLDPGCAFDAQVLLSGARIASVGQASAGILVEKVGSTTGKTRGLIEGTGEYRVQPTNFMMSGMQIGRVDTTTDLSLPGDSGAAWYDPNSSVGLGLHVASGVDATGHAFALACNLDTVLETLGVTL